jgi:hypothetical protein
MQSEAIESLTGRAGLDPERTYSPGEAAAYLRVTTATLAKWRCFDKGPAYLKVGKAISYRGRDLIAFEARCVVTPRGARS